MPAPSRLGGAPHIGDRLPGAVGSGTIGGLGKTCKKRWETWKRGGEKVEKPPSVNVRGVSWAGGSDDHLMSGCSLVDGQFPLRWSGAVARLELRLRPPPRAR